MEICLSGPIFTLGIYTQQSGRLILWQIIYFLELELDPFFYDYVFNKTMSLINEKYILVYLNQYLSRKP